MNRVLAVFTLSALIASQAQAQIPTRDQNYYKIKSVVTKEITEQNLPVVVVPSEPADFDLAPAEAEVLDITSFLSLDAVVNIGKGVWTVVQAGKPTTDTKFDTANALPGGATDWTELEGWGAPEFKTFNVQYKNIYDMTVVDFTYRVMYIANGNVKGIGQYLANVTVIPVNLSVAWGFKFNVSAAIPTVTNIGTAQNPLAAMQVNLRWSASSFISSEESSRMFYITGDGEFKEIN